MQEFGKKKLVTLSGGKLNIANITVRCGPTNLVNRRKRSTQQELSFNIVIKVTTTKEKALQVNYQCSLCYEECRNSPEIFIVTISHNSYLTYISFYATLCIAKSKITFRERRFIPIE